MITLEVKPLSVNEVWQGRRFKTEKYEDYELLVTLKLPKLTIPAGKLKVKYIFGLSSKAADVDNCVKPFTDILQKKYGFNDKLIYEMDIRKEDVKKGQEFIKFQIEKN